MRNQLTTLARDAVYWDRAEGSVRDWRTGVHLPLYQGPCLIYFDLRGPTMMYTFLQDGKRCWREMQPRPTAHGKGRIIERGQA